MAKVKMTKQDVLTMADGLRKAKLTGHKFTYAVKMNKEVVLPCAKAIEAAISPPEEYKKYQSELEKLNISMANKDPKGNAVKFRFQNGFVYDIPGVGVDNSPYEKAITVLKKQHKEAIEKWEAQEKENEAFLAEEESLDLIMINLDMVPLEVPQDVMDGLFYMIKKVDPKEFE